MKSFKLRQHERSIHQISLNSVVHMSRTPYLRDHWGQGRVENVPMAFLLIPLCNAVGEHRVGPPGCQIDSR